MEPTLLTSEAIGTMEWQRIYAVYVECWRALDRGEPLPEPLLSAMNRALRFYAEVGRDRTGATALGASAG